MQAGLSQFCFKYFSVRAPSHLSVPAVMVLIGCLPMVKSLHVTHQSRFAFHLIVCIQGVLEAHVLDKGNILAACTAQPDWALDAGYDSAIIKAVCCPWDPLQEKILFESRKVVSSFMEGTFEAHILVKSGRLAIFASYSDWGLDAVQDSILIMAWCAALPLHLRAQTGLNVFHRAQPLKAVSLFHTAALKAHIYVKTAKLDSALIMAWCTKILPCHLEYPSSLSQGMPVKGIWTQLPSEALSDSSHGSPMNKDDPEDPRYSPLQPMTDTLSQSSPRPFSALPAIEYREHVHMRDSDGISPFRAGEVHDPVIDRQAPLLTQDVLQVKSRTNRNRELYHGWDIRVAGGWKKGCFGTVKATMAGELSAVVVLEHTREEITVSGLPLTEAQFASTETLKTLRDTLEARNHHAPLRVAELPLARTQWPEVIDFAPVTPMLPPSSPIISPSPAGLAPGEWLRQPALAGQFLDLLIRDDVYWNGSLYDQTAYVERIPGNFKKGKNTTMSIKSGLAATKVRKIRLVFLEPLTTNELEGYVSKADAVPITTLWGVQVVVIGPTMNGDWHWVGYRGQTNDDSTGFPSSLALSHERSNGSPATQNSPAIHILFDHKLGGNGTKVYSRPCVQYTHQSLEEVGEEAERNYGHRVDDTFVLDPSDYQA
ncbi:hypothetical protein C8J57DRAFT_1255322 [Mycena rebaudengoi]|nr:hypothetical protein C8J57DRAFT_1255322 [Mycena rebaudengoi]